MPLLGDTLRCEPVVWRSALSVDQAESALRAVGLTGLGSMMSWDGAALRGHVRHGNVGASRRTAMNNSWSPVFVGELAPLPTGVMLAGEIRTPRFTRIAYPILTLFFCLGPIAAITAAGADPFAFVTLVFPLFAIGLAHFGTWLARDHWAFVRTTIADAIHGVEGP